MMRMLRRSCWVARLGEWYRNQPGLLTWSISGNPLRRLYCQLHRPAEVNTMRIPKTHTAEKRRDPGYIYAIVAIIRGLDAGERLRCWPLGIPRLDIRYNNMHRLLLYSGYSSIRYALHHLSLCCANQSIRIPPIDAGQKRLFMARAARALHGLPRNPKPPF